MSILSVKEMVVQDHWAKAIFVGLKTVEGRKADPNNWGSLQVGQLIKIISKQSGNYKMFKVVRLTIYPSLTDYLINEGLRHTLPGITTLNEAELIYLGFDGTDLETMEKRRQEYIKYGALAIELSPAHLYVQ